MLTNMKSESNAPFLKSPPLAHKIIFFEKKSTSSSKMGFSIDWRQCGNNLALCYFAVVIELPDSLWMNCKSEFGIIF